MDVIFSGIFNPVFLPELNVFWEAWYAFSALSWHLKRRINLRQIIYIYIHFSRDRLSISQIFRDRLFILPIFRNMLFFPKCTCPPPPFPMVNRSKKEEKVCKISVNPFLWGALGRRLAADGCTALLTTMERLQAPLSLPKHLEASYGSWVLHIVEGKRGILDIQIILRSSHVRRPLQ